MHKKFTFIMEEQSIEMLFLRNISDNDIYCAKWLQNTDTFLKFNF